MRNVVTLVCGSGRVTDYLSQPPHKSGSQGDWPSCLDHYTASLEVRVIDLVVTILQPGSEGD